jgi:hypothetical protein
MSDKWCHAILYVKEVWLNIGIKESLEERTVKESDIAITTHAGCWQLVWVTYQKDFLHSRLQGNQEIRLSSLCGLVDDETGYLPS